MEGLVLPGHRQLLGRHVDPHHLASFPHQLAQQVCVSPGTAAQIKHPATLQQRRAHQTATVVAVAHLWVHPRQQRLQPGGYRIGIATGIRF